MQKINEKTKNKLNFKHIFLSKTLAEKSAGKRVAYIAVMTALTVIANMFFEFKLADTQFSFTIVVSALAGIIIGPFFGLASSFLGDLVGFLYHSSGYPYMPWIGISMGVVSLISGLIINGLSFEFKGGIYLKIALVCVSTFLICTVAINTTAFWILYAKVPYFTYLISRLFVQGQIWNSLVNYALLFIIIPIIIRIKALHFKF